MLKVLHVYKSFFPETNKEIEQYIYTVCKATEKYGVYHTVLCTHDGDEPNATAFEGIPILKYPRSIKFRVCPVSFKLLLNFKKEIEHADIVHYHHPWLFGDLLSLLNSKKKHVVTYHSDMRRKRNVRKICSYFDKYFLSKADKLIATFPSQVDSYKNLKKFSEKVSVVPSTVIKEDYPAPDILSCRKIKAKFGKFLLCIEQPKSNKGLSLLIEAMKEINYNLVIVRSAKNNSRKILENKLSRNVYFLENITKKRKVNYLNSCSCVILPSVTKKEATETSLLEGAMFGKPLISCDIKNRKEHVNLDNKTGFVIAPTVSNFRVAINKLLNNSDLSKRLGNNASKRFYKTFNSDIVGKQLANLYKELMVEELQTDKVLA